MQTFEGCRPDVEDISVQFVLKRLQKEDLDRFEDHLTACANCRAVVSLTRTIVQALRDATV